MKRATIISCLTFLTLSTLANALEAKETNIPDAVIAEIKSLENECRLEESSTPQSDSNYDYIKRADLNGDGIDDYVIEDGYVPCEAGASFRHGNGGTGVIIFAGTSNGAIKAFDKTVFGISIEGASSKPVAWVAVGGHYCGQKTFVSRAAAIRCDRPLIWNASSKQFNFAPLKKARFPSEL